MCKKCIACPPGRSDSIDEPGIPPLCRSCWNHAGPHVRVGRRVVATEDDTSAGTVRKIEDGNIAVFDCDDGGEAWIPTPLVVAVKK